MFEEYFFEKQRVINIFAQFHMRIEFSLKSIGYNNFNEQMMISEDRVIAEKLSANKTRYACPIAEAISTLEDENKRFPPLIRRLFERMAQEPGLSTSGGKPL